MQAQLGLSMGQKGIETKCIYRVSWVEKFCKGHKKEREEEDDEEEEGGERGQAQRQSSGKTNGESLKQMTVWGDVAIHFFGLLSVMNPSLQKVCFTILVLSVRNISRMNCYRGVSSNKPGQVGF